MNKEVSFKQSRVIQTSFLLFLMGFLVSFLPEENWLLLGFNFILATFGTFLFIILWRIYREQSKRYFSLLSYVMLNVLSIYFSIPLFRIAYGTLAFWIGIIILITIVLLPYMYSEKIAVAIQKPNQSKLGKLYLFYAPLIVLFGGILFTGSVSSTNPDALMIAIFLFLGAVLFLFITPVLLITPQRMEKL